MELGNSDNNFCQKTDDTCSSIKQVSFQVQNQFSLNIGGTVGAKKRDGAAQSPNALTPEKIQATFNVGATWSYTTTNTTATSDTNGKPSYAMDQCGYFTYLPYYVT